MYQHLSNSNRILLSGCGGGYDIFCGLDLFFNMHQHKTIILGNYSFTDKYILDLIGEKITPCCYRLDFNSLFDEKQYTEQLKNTIKIPPNFILEEMKVNTEEYIKLQINNYGDHVYFPEYKLVKYLHDKYNIQTHIYCFTDTGIKFLLEAYNIIIETEQIDTVILIDGGTDSLMTGSERDSLGSPFEDISSIVAVANCDVKYKFLYCLGYNVDQYHGVTDENFLKNTSALIQKSGFIGSYMSNQQNISTQQYIDTFLHCDPENSIVNSLIIASLQGYYGDYEPVWIQHRLGDSKQYIHPLMSLYWIYNLTEVYHKLKYDVQKLRETVDSYEVVKLLKFIDN